MIFAVDHKLRASLVEARTPDGAVRKARRYFGQYAEPITIPENQDEAIASAKSMGAGIIAFVLLLLSVGVAQAEPSKIGDSVNDCLMWFDRDNGLQLEGKGCRPYVFMSKSATELISCDEAVNVCEVRDPSKFPCYERMREAMRMMCCRSVERGEETDPEVLRRRDGGS